MEKIKQWFRHVVFEIELFICEIQVKLGVI